jgi:hypothetical protein
MARHMAEHINEYIAIRRVCQLAENRSVLSIWGLDIPLCPVSPDPNFIPRIAYDKDVSHCENVIHWLQFYQKHDHPSFSAYPLVGATLKTTKRSWDDRFILMAVDAAAEVHAMSRFGRLGGPRLDLVGNDIAKEIDDSRMAKIALVQSYLIAVITKVYEGYKNERDLDHMVGGKIFVVLHDGDVCVNVGEEGGPYLFKLNGMLKDRCFGGEGAKEVIECLDKHVKEERARQASFMVDLIGGMNNNGEIHMDAGAGKLKYVLGDVGQAARRLRRSGQAVMHVAQNTMIQGQ